jgi:hypothetical protein
VTRKSSGRPRARIVIVGVVVMLVIAACQGPTTSPEVEGRIIPSTVPSRPSHSS